jgi:hypothetical protein
MTFEGQGMNVKIAMVILSVLASFAVSSAEAQAGECSGILHQEKGSLEFGGRPGESEGLCVVARSEWRKILATCAVGQFCRVSGITAPCRGSGECTEISRITSVTKHLMQRL